MTLNPTPSHREPLLSASISSCTLGKQGTEKAAKLGINPSKDALGMGLFLLCQGDISPPDRLSRAALIVALGPKVRYCPPGNNSILEYRLKIDSGNQKTSLHSISTPSQVSRPTETSICSRGFEDSIRRLLAMQISDYGRRAASGAAQDPMGASFS